MLDDSNPAPLRRGGNDFELPGFPPSALLETGPDNEYYFVSRFVDLITSSRHGYNPLRPRSWVFDLPNLLSTTDVPSVKYSIRAAALMYVAVAHRDRRAEADAVRWYLTSLESYRATLGRREDGATVAQPMPDGKTICVPMMFLYFESMRGASESWALHHRAVAEMLEARGPFNCSAGMEHGMMRSVRAMEVSFVELNSSPPLGRLRLTIRFMASQAFDSILQNRPSRFATPEWCLIPFRQSRKISFDRLIDVLLSFPSQLQLPRADKTGSSLRNDIRGVHDLATDQKNAIEDRVNILLLQLQWWWWDFEEEHTGASPASVCPEADSPEHESPLSRAASCMFVHRDTLTANASALYSAASIILHSVLLVLALSKPPALIGADVVSLVNISQSSIASHASSVLRAAAYLTETSPFCGDTLRTIVAVQIVSLLALEDSKREQAQSMLAKWNYPRGTCPVS